MSLAGRLIDELVLIEAYIIIISYGIGCSLLRHNPLILVLQYMAIPKNKKAVRIKHILILTEDEFVIILNLLAKQCFYLKIYSA